MIHTLIEALTAVIEHNARGLKASAIADRMGKGVSASILYAWCNGTKPMPLDRLIQFVLITEDMRPIEALCRKVGGTYFPVRPSKHPVTRKLSVKLIKEFSDVLQAAEQAVLDERWTRAELRKFRKEKAEFLQASADYSDDIERRAEAVLR